MSFSVPDYMFDSFSSITPEFLKNLGIRCVLCDIDNTLVTYDDAIPTESVLMWLASMKENGITIIFLSNNNKERVAKFAEKLDNTWFARAAKPISQKAKKALATHGFSPKETAILGDQIFTDIWTGGFLGVAATLLVPPIKDKTDLFTKSKRFLERPFLSRYKKREQKRQQQTKQEV